MDELREHRFIQSFVQRERQERAWFELSSPRRRGRFLGRLCHSYANILDMRYARPLPDMWQSPDRATAYLIQQKAPTHCYVVSSIDGIDGTEMSLHDALNHIYGYGLPSILICIDDRLAYFQAEQEVGKTPRYWLERVTDSEA